MNKNNLPKKDINIVRHSLAHILATAILEMFPEAKFGVGPNIENGFYYDFDLPRTLIPEDLPLIEAAMRKIINKNLPFERQEISHEEAVTHFNKANQNYKVEILESEAKDPQVTIYKTNNFVDLCRGPHIDSTGEIDATSFKLTKIAGAYWRGDEKNKMLQRIYGVAFQDKNELKEYFKQQEEAEKRDHRKLGRELDLFHIDDVVGLGMPLWHPKGAMLWRVIEDFWYAQHLTNGYSLVRSPHIGNKILWETSGHWGFYNDSMYPPLEVGQTLKESQENKSAKEPEQFLLKPMNCPFHIQIFKNRLHSYRELPLRWAECGTVYRFEKKGELSGLTRVRGFTQDDAHIICAADQVEDELKKVVDFILFIFKSFGFDISKINVYLSVRDPKNTKYAGTEEGWKFTEAVLEKIAKEKGLNYKKDIGGAVFYGPKLDFKIKDALNREWQCSTLQFDFNLPERFKMTFINNEGKEEQPYMLHRALFGSYERFIGLLIEHYAGAFPTWLAPVQVRVVPISTDKHMDYAKKIYADLLANGIRAELDETNETLGKKVRIGEMQKIPYQLVVGDKEIETESVNIRSRGSKETKTVEIKKFIEMIKKEIEEKG